MFVPGTTLESPLAGAHPNGGRAHAIGTLSTIARIAASVTCVALTILSGAAFIVTGHPAFLALGVVSGIAAFIAWPFSFRHGAAPVTPTHHVPHPPPTYFPPPPFGFTPPPHPYAFSPPRANVGDHQAAGTPLMAPLLVPPPQQHVPIGRPHIDPPPHLPPSGGGRGGPPQRTPINAGGFHQQHIQVGGHHTPATAPPHPTGRGGSFPSPFAAMPSPHQHIQVGGHHTPVVEPPPLHPPSAGGRGDPLGRAGVGNHGQPGLPPPSPDPTARVGVGTHTTGV